MMAALKSTGHGDSCGGTPLNSSKIIAICRYHDMIVPVDVTCKFLVGSYSTLYSVRGTEVLAREGEP